MDGSESYMKKITPKDLKEKLDVGKATILDIRSKETFALHALEHNNANKINIPKYTIFSLENTNSEVDLPFSKDTEVFITCTTGNSAENCASILSDKGYNVTVLEGGMAAWNLKKEEKAKLKEEKQKQKEKEEESNN